MSIAVFPDRPWMTRWVKAWGEKNPNVTLKIDDIAYADMNTKQLTELATGTLQDVSFSREQVAALLRLQGRLLSDGRLHQGQAVRQGQT